MSGYVRWGAVGLTALAVGCQTAEERLTQLKLDLIAVQNDDNSVLARHKKLAEESRQKIVNLEVTLQDPKNHPDLKKGLADAKAELKTANAQDLSATRTNALNYWKKRVKLLDTTQRALAIVMEDYLDKLEDVDLEMGKESDPRLGGKPSGYFALKRMVEGSYSEKLKNHLGRLNKIDTRDELNKKIEAENQDSFLKAHGRLYKQLETYLNIFEKENTAETFEERDKIYGEKLTAATELLSTVREATKYVPKTRKVGEKK